MRPPSIIAMRLPILKASSRSWLTKIIVRPRCFCSSNNSSCRRVRIRGSSAENGSSISRIGASVAKARARPTRCCIPPESSPTSASARSARPTISSSWSTRVRRAAGSMPASSSPRPTLSRTVRHGKRPNCWNTIETLSRRTRRRSASELLPTLQVQSPSKIRTSPRITGFRPLTARSSVDLPEPDSPISTRISPASTFSEQLCTPKIWSVFSRISGRPSP